jgi:hypothetical protein
MRQQNQKELLNTCDEIKFDGVDYYTGNGEAYISDNVSRRHDTVPDNSCTRDDNHFDFTVNMLCNNEVGSGEEDKGTKLCDITGHLPAQGAELKLQTEAVDIRAHSARDLRKKVDVSDNLSHKQMGSLFDVLEIRGSLYVQARLCNLFKYEFEVQCSDPTLGHTRPIPFSVRPAIREQIRQMIAECFRNFYFKSREIINCCTKRRKGASHLCRDKESEQVHFI